MQVIAVNGTSNSGKTTVSQIIIKGLRRRGYSVGSVKEIHSEGFTLDPDPKTDTALHRAAGSQLVTARALTETGILHQSKLSIEEILMFYDHDYVILEGVSDCNAPRIITAHTKQEVAERLDDRVVAISGVIANERAGKLYGLPIINAVADEAALVDFVKAKAFRPLPSFAEECCRACGYSCRELAGRIAQGKAKREDCLIAEGPAELYIDGKKIPLVPFVQKILKNAVLGVARELDGFKEHAQIEVRLKR